MFKYLAIVTHPFISASEPVAKEIAAYLREKGIQVDLGSLYDDHLTEGLQSGRYDLWIAMGGDGTMLRSGQLCGPVGIAVLGLNMGRLGFLMDIQRNDWQGQMERLLGGDFWLEKRMMLKAVLTRKGEQLGAWDVLNEAIVSRADIVRPVHLSTSVDNTYLTTYVADGLIAATPTGSTAYSLAAGGPILPPQLRNYLIVPVAPHMSFNRAIVLAEDSTVSIVVGTRHKAALSLDGQRTIELIDGDRVDVRVSEHTVHFVRLQEPDYFYRNLTSKMNANMTDQELKND